MLKNDVENRLASYISIGTFVVTVFLLTNSVTDPVNVTKLFALGLVALPLFTLAVIFGRKIIFSSFKPFLISLTVFISVMFFASISSRGPFSQNYFGEFGRNNGMLTYTLLAGIALSASLLVKTESFVKIFYSFFAAGFLNIVYCAWVLAFGDFIPWNNPYGNILGLFGNPDFISAFLGMFIAGSLAYISTAKTPNALRLTLGLASLVATFEIIKSHAIQGLVVTAVGVAIVGFYIFRAHFKSNLIAYAYSLGVIVFGVIAIFGTLQKGPLSFVYKRSVSLRGSYWRAGLEMGNSHPLTGIGLDTYGDWYRRTRPNAALIDTPGVNTVSNVAHNVVIDFFASGGYPLLISYLGVLSFGAISIYRVTKRTREYDRVFVGLTVVWLCYQVQSIISINQIGLAIWGWVLTGLLVAYEYSTRVKDQELLRNGLDKNRRKDQENVLSPQLIAGIAMVFGLLITLPPMSADSKWYSATRSNSAAKVEAALIPSYFNPADSFRYAQAVELFQNSNLPNLAYKYALIAVKFNPDYFDAWKQLYLLPGVSVSDKSTALSNMKRLDPRNPEVIAAK